LQQALLLQTLSFLFRIRFVFSSAAARSKTFFLQEFAKSFCKAKNTHQVHSPIPTSHCYAKMNAAKKHKERFENQNSNDLSNSFTKP
jgi:hypothetical protein